MSAKGHTWTDLTCQRCDVELVNLLTMSVHHFIENYTIAYFTYLVNNRFWLYKHTIYK